MSGIHVALRYARALYLVAGESSTLPQAAEDMERIAQILESVPGVREFCRKGGESPASRMMFLETAFLPHIGEQAGRLLRTAVLNGRLEAVPLLPGAFRQIFDREAGIVPVVLETTAEPDDRLLELVAEKMKSRTGRTARILQRTVPKLKGGFRIIWENRMIDRSVARRLRTLRRTINEL